MTVSITPMPGVDYSGLLSAQRRSDVAGAMSGRFRFRTSGEQWTYDGERVLFGCQKGLLLVMWRKTTEIFQSGLNNCFQSSPADTVPPENSDIEPEHPTNSNSAE